MFTAIRNGMARMFHIRHPNVIPKNESGSLKSGSSVYMTAESLLRSGSSPVANLQKLSAGRVDLLSSLEGPRQEDGAGESKGNELGTFFSGKEFLIVDDMPFNLIMLEATLRKFEIICTRATSGSQANELAAKHKFDVIIMDYNMPEMNGDAAIQLIRKIKHCKDVIIIGYSSDDTSQIQQAFKKAGADDVVTKPAVTKNLLQRIQKVMETKATTGSQKKD